MSNKNEVLSNNHVHIYFDETQRLFIAQELSLYNGTDEQLPIFLGILG